MTPTAVYAASFSPTGTSRKIAGSIARALAGGGAPTEIDLTHPSGREQTLAADAAAVIAVPVYGGDVAPTALERLRSLHGRATPAVVVVLYGNRAFGRAAVRLAQVVAEQGFVPVAAAAFVGEHSYSTPRTPIAAGRPDENDLRQATAFGGRIREKLLHGAPAPVDAARLKEPRTPLWSLLRFVRFVLAYRRAQKRHPVVLVPETDERLCTHCGRCAALCPVEAIDRSDCLGTDPARCIRCCACVKGCPVGARSLRTPFAAALARNFSRRKPPVTLL